MSTQTQLQKAATRLYKLHSSTEFYLGFLTIAPILTFLLPRRQQFSSSSSPHVPNKKNPTVKEVDVPGHIFRIPGVKSTRPSDVPDFLNDLPPSSKTPPFLKIVMSDQ